MEPIEYIHGDAKYLIKNYPNANYIDGYDNMLFGIIPQTLQLIYIGKEFFENLKTVDEESHIMQFGNLENFSDQNFAENNNLLKSFVNKLWEIPSNRRHFIVHPSSFKRAANGTEGELN